MPLESLFCDGCADYVHPFLEACPGCGLARGSRFDDAVATPRLGFRALLAEPRITDGVREAVLRYSIKLAGSSPASEVADGFGVVADSLPYAVQLVGSGPAASRQAHLELGSDDLVVRERNPSREVARVPLRGILAIQAAGDGSRGDRGWQGFVAFGRPVADGLPAVAGDLVVTFAEPVGFGRLAVSNRRGITVARARPDHYTLVRRWLGLIAAAASEDRWCAVGPASHAAEVRLEPPAAPAGAEAAHIRRPTAEGGSVAASLAESLVTLDELRARGLVTESEYLEKRREILARL